MTYLIVILNPRLNLFPPAQDTTTDIVKILKGFIPGAFIISGRLIADHSLRRSLIFRVFEKLA